MAVTELSFGLIGNILQQPNHTNSSHHFSENLTRPSRILDSSRNHNRNPSFLLVTQFTLHDDPRVFFVYAKQGCVTSQCLQTGDNGWSKHGGQSTCSHASVADHLLACHVISSFLLPYCYSSYAIKVAWQVNITCTRERFVANVLARAKQKEQTPRLSRRLGEFRQHQPV